MPGWIWPAILILALAIWTEHLTSPISFTITFDASDQRPTTTTMAAYDQFILFGDSLFQHSSDQVRGFGLHSALQAGQYNAVKVLSSLHWSADSLRIHKTLRCDEQRLQVMLEWKSRIGSILLIVDLVATTLSKLSMSCPKSFLRPTRHA
jgi:hypothetical protein